MRTIDPSLWARRDEPKVREFLIEHFRYLVTTTVAKRLPGIPRRIDRNDLIADGHLGLIQAVDRFIPNSGTQFTSFAITRIWGAMQDGMRRDDWLPRRVREAQRESGATEDEVRVLSLYEPFRNAPDEDADCTIEDGWPDPRVSVEEHGMRAWESALLWGQVSQLPDHWRRAVILYYWHGLTQGEIAKATGWKVKAACNNRHLGVKRLRVRVPQEAFL